MSVCIVHRDGWGVCDSRSNYNGSCIMPEAAQKMMVVDNYSIVTSCGDAIIHQDLTEMLVNVPQSASVEQVISEYFAEGGDIEGTAMQSVMARRIDVIDMRGHRSVLQDTENFWAIGCAADMVLGYLKAVEACKGKVEPKDAEEAIKMASRYDGGIDDRCQVYRLGEVL